MGRGEPAKPATAVSFEQIRSCAIARFARSVSAGSLTWGFASLHPRLYAFTCYAGLGSTDPDYLFILSTKVREPNNMDHNSSDWIECETTTHQDHVIAHVVGATVLGWFIAGEAAHLLLDIGFLWTVYLDGEMNLLPQGVAIPELDAGELSSADRTELAFDAQLLLSEGREAGGLRRFTAAPVECLIQSVDFFAANSGRRLAIRGEVANFEMETSLESNEISVRPEPH
jgi:hypothetical protein